MSKKNNSESSVTITELLNRRSDNYEIATDAMFKKLRKITAILEEKIKEDPTFKDGVCFWHDITEDRDMDDAIFLHMSITFAIGTLIVTPEGKTITITEETVDYFNKEVVIGIAKDVVELTSKKKIRKALAKAAKNDASDTVNAIIEATETTEANESITADDMKRLLLVARNPTGIKH
jgi:hypothetical protein